MPSNVSTDPSELHGNGFGWTLGPHSNKTAMIDFSNNDSNIINRLINSFSIAISQQSQETIETELIHGKNSFLAYWLSPFALMCMITALVMNRIIIFASSRRNRELPWISNLMLRSFAIFLLTRASYGILVACKCYIDNPIVQFLLRSKFWDYDQDRFSKMTFLSLNFGDEWFYTSRGNDIIYAPTTSILKPFHLALCLSQVLETFISVASGSRPAIETGITLFEYSLAFQEATPYQFPSVQLLYIGLIALVNQLNIHLLGLFNLQNFRLISSTIIGLFTLGYYLYNILIGELIRMPFIIVIGYFPHFCILLVITFSYLIYLLTAIFIGSFDDLTMSSIMGSLNSANISLKDDFYTALILYGEFIINVSIHQSYIEETGGINLPNDNYVSEGLRNITNVSYGNKIQTHPDLDVTPRVNKKRDRNSWALKKRITSMNRIIKKFLVLIKVKLRSKNAAQRTGGQNAGPVMREFEERTVIDINEIDDDKLADQYIDLLMKNDLSEIDCSPDFLDEEAADDYDDDYDDDYEEDEEEEQHAEIFNQTAVNNNNSLDATQIQNCSEKDLRIYNYHMQHMECKSSVLTRSHFAKYYVDDLKLLDIVREQVFDNNHLNEDEDSLGVCVICHVNSRQIVLWPCKCLAICESCRISLSLREFRTCVCCRRPVEGYSKVYVP